MSLYSELLANFLLDLQTGIRMPIKVDEETWDEKWIDYQTILKCYCTGTVARKVFLWKYKSLPQIETIPNEEKIAWRKFVNEIFPGTSPEFRLESLKIIYSIGILTNQ